MKGHMEEYKRHFLPCRCGCGIVEFLRDKDDVEDTLYLSYYPLGFYAHQRVFWERIKAIWRLIIGKEYRLYDIVVNYEDFKKIAEKLEEQENTEA